MVADVAEERPRVLVHERHPRAASGGSSGRPAASVARRNSSDLPLELVDPAARVRARPGRSGRRPRPPARPGRCAGSPPHPGSGRRRRRSPRTSPPRGRAAAPRAPPPAGARTVPSGLRLAVPHGHHEGVAHEDHQLAGGDGVAVVVVGDRLEHQEERVVVDLQLRPLVGASARPPPPAGAARTPR